MDFHELELDIEPRAGAATYRLRWSDNGGKTFGDFVEKEVPATSVDNPSLSDINPMWRQMGAGRDRVFEFSTDAPVKVVWLDAYLQATPGVH